MKQVDSVEIKGYVFTLSDMTFAFGYVSKNKTSSKDVVLRVELRCLVSTMGFES